MKIPNQTNVSEMQINLYQQQKKNSSSKWSNLIESSSMKMFVTNQSDELSNPMSLVYIQYIGHINELSYALFWVIDQRKIAAWSPPLPSNSSSKYHNQDYIIIFFLNK